MRTTPPIYKYSGMIAGFGLAALVIGLVILIANDALQLAAFIILGIGVILLITAIVMDFTRVKGAVTGRRGRFGAGNTVMVFVFVGVIVVVNAISFTANARFDVTELSQFTLTTQTKDILESMDTPVEVLCFFTPDDSYGISQYASSLLEEYSLYTDQLDIKTIDPDEHPDQAREYNISQYQTVVFESEIGRRAVTPEEIYAEAEHSFTSAILEVTGVVQKTVYFLTGHGEARIDSEYAYATLALLDNLYKVESLDLMAIQAIPDDCSVLVIAAPETDFNAFEQDIIQSYLEDNGTVLVLTNPGPPESLKSLLADWWLEIEDGTIIDPSAYYATMDIPIVPRTQNAFGLTEVYFPGAAAIKAIQGSPDTIVNASLLSTSALSWSELNYDPNEEPKFNEATEDLGERSVAAIVYTVAIVDGQAVEKDDYTQLLVVGDSDFATNQNFYNGDNAYQYIYFIEYLTSGEQLVSIERKVLPYRSLVITSEQETLMRVSSIGLMPLIVLLIGGFIWWRRR